MAVIEVKKLKELQELFKKSPVIVGQELEKATLSAMRKIETTARQETPVRTGKLKKSFRSHYRPIVAKIYPTEKYAIFVHEGTKPHTIEPRTAESLRFKIGNRWVFAKRVEHPGTKPNKFMDRAAKKDTPRINKIFEGAARIIAKRLGG